MVNLEIKQCILTNNNCYKQGRKITPTGIVVHSTGANNPKLSRYVQPDDGILGSNKYSNHWNQGGISKCVHAFIGKDKNGIVRVYQTLPWNFRCWGCGSGKKGSYNNSYIQFEIAEDSLTDANYFNEAFRLAIELCAYLAKKYNIPIKNIVSHQEAYKAGYASNHGDCDHWLKKFGKNMDWFRDEVKILQNQTTTTAPSATTSTPRSYLMKGDKGTEVKTMQENLIYVGYSCGNFGADGDFGVSTDKAVREFQKENGLTVDGKYGATSKKKLEELVTKKKNSNTYTRTQFIKDVQTAIGVKPDGIVGNKTLAALVTVSKTKNRKHAVVKPLQKRLNALGFNCGTPDGVAGERFDSAAKRWAKENGCVPDGEFTKGGKSWQTILRLA